MYGVIHDDSFQVYVCNHLQFYMYIDRDSFQFLEERRDEIFYHHYHASIYLCREHI